jgi:hypothetical protein
MLQASGALWFAKNRCGFESVKSTLGQPHPRLLTRNNVQRRIPSQFHYSHRRGYLYHLC